VTIRAVFFDFGGVIQRTEYQSPRQQLAERFNMDYEEIDRLVFDTETARRASIGGISEQAHWQEVLKRLKLPASEVRAFSDAFFGGDIVDRSLVEFIRGLRGSFHTGLISNAWGGLREYLVQEKIVEIFDTIIISAEVGVVKPDAQIFKIALEQAKVHAEQAVFVDDIQANIEGCEEVGMQGVLFNDPEETLGQLKQILKIN